MENKKDKLIRRAMSELAKRSHRKSPRSREFYVEMARKRWAELSPTDACSKQDNVLDS